MYTNFEMENLSGKYSETKTGCGGRVIQVAMFQIKVETDAQVPGSNPHLILLY